MKDHQSKKAIKLSEVKLVILHFLITFSNVFTSEKRTSAIDSHSYHHFI